MAYDMPREDPDSDLIDEMLTHLQSNYADQEPASEVAKFYANRSVFVTGATGFIGKAIVEKLVRSCRDIKRIYLLVREKRGKDTKERLHDLLQAQIFNRIKAYKGGNELLLEKIRAIKGDITLPNFGISPEDLVELRSDVSIVFNSAATVRFVEPIDAAVRNNIQSVSELANFCDQLDNLQALVHLSTAYSNCHKRDTIYEVFYEPPTRGEQIISAMDHLKALSSSIHSYPSVKSSTKDNGDDNKTSGDYERDACELQTFYFDDDYTNRDKQQQAAALSTSMDSILEVFSRSVLKCSNRPNTYTFTKAISEGHLLDLMTARSDRYLGEGKIPVAIVRPSIVGGAWREPDVGSVDSFNGPTGAMLSLYTGALQAMPGNGQRVADMVPVDMVVNMVLSCGWYLVSEREKQTATSGERSESSNDKIRSTKNSERDSSAEKMIKKDKGIYVFNFVSGYRNPLRWHQVTDMIHILAYKFPSKFLVRLPSSYFIEAGKFYNLYDFVNHKLPALVIDFVKSKLLKQELTSRTSAVAAYNRIRQMTETLTPFTSNQWRLCDSNVCALYEKLSPIDRQLFQFDITKIKWNDYIRNYMIGARIYTLRDAPKNVPAAKRRLQMRQRINWLLMAIGLILVYCLFFRQPEIETALIRFLAGLVGWP